jgi:hypothetical protein
MGIKLVLASGSKTRLAFYPVGTITFHEDKADGTLSCNSPPPSADVKQCFVPALMCLHVLMLISSFEAQTPIKQDLKIQFLQNRK